MCKTRKQSNMSVLILRFNITVAIFEQSASSHPVFPPNGRQSYRRRGANCHELDTRLRHNMLLFSVCRKRKLRSKSNVRRSDSLLELNRRRTERVAPCCQVMYTSAASRRCRSCPECPRLRCSSSCRTAAAYNYTPCIAY